MGNTNVKPYPRHRNRKQVHWKAADRPLPPGKPYHDPTTEPTPENVSIRWSKPAKDGGSPISGYLVEHRKVGTAHWTRATPLLVPDAEVTLSGLEPGWRYQFRVSAENAVGISEPSEISEPVIVTFQKSAVSPPKFVQELQDAVGLENQKVEFTVYFYAQPMAKVCWFKDGFEIFSSGRVRIFTEHDRSIFTIQKCLLSDEGEIKCTATNRAGHISTKAKLTVEAPPSIKLPKNYEEGLLFELGEVMRLKVSIFGRPTPLVFWCHNGESIQSNDRYEIEQGEKSSILKLEEALRTDRGEYQVKAVNKLGEDVQSFLVTITDKPSPPGRARVLMALGRSVTLSWSTPQDDGGCKIGNYIVEYYRLGWNVWLKAATTRQLSTVLGDLIEGSEYKFRIKAESPYGVSDPSEETDVVFIPDPKRGILKPQQTRGRSQPRDFLDEVAAPVAAKRKKARSQSVSSVGENMNGPVTFKNNIYDEVPVRPERKIKSPPQTPSLYNRKPMLLPENNTAVTNANKSSNVVKDRKSSIPDIKINKVPSPPKTSSDFSSSSDRSTTPSPVLYTQSKITTFSVNSDQARSMSPQRSIPSPYETHSQERNESPFERTPSPSQGKNASQLRRTSSPHEVTPIVKTVEPTGRTHSPNRIAPPSPPAIPGSPITKSRSTSPVRHTNKSPRENTDNFTGSSEFMLVLYSGENKDQGSSSDIAFDFEEDSIPPPMSLSAPELGIDPPVMFSNLKLSASSTELLHERAMARFYQAAETEQAELEKRRKVFETGTVEIPKIQINSLDNQEIVGLERKHSLRRRMSAGGITQHHALSAQRRHSLRNANELEDIIENRLHKQPFFDEIQKVNALSRKAVKDVKAAIQNQASVDSIDSNKYQEEYEESLSESETESSEDERRYAEDTPKTLYYAEEEDETYSIRSKTFIKNDEPFEILTHKKDLPDPNFKPKPILKKTEHEDLAHEVIDIPEVPDIKSKGRSHSPMPQSIFQRERSKSLADQLLDGISYKTPVSGQRSPTVKKRSLSLVSEDLDPEDAKKLIHDLRPASPRHNVSNVAKISGLTAASIVIPENLLQKKKDEEEAKVVIDHYGDIVRNFGQKKRTTPPLYLDRDELKKVAEASDTSHEDIYDAVYEPSNIATINQEDEEITNYSKPESIHPENKKSYSPYMVPETMSQYNNRSKPPYPSDYIAQNYSKTTGVHSEDKKPFTAYIHPESHNPHFDRSKTPSPEERYVSKTHQRSPSVSPPPVQRSIRSIHHHRQKRKVSPSPQRQSFDSSRTRTSSQSSSSSRRSSTKSPARPENWSPSRTNHRNYSPSHFERGGSRHRSKSPSPYNERKRINRKITPSPQRKEISSRPSSQLSDTVPRRKKTSPSPVRRNNRPVRKSESKSPSPVPLYLRRPMLKEITTQTSVGLESYSVDTQTTGVVRRNSLSEEIIAQTEIKVRSAFDYVTDLAMFIVACWLYLFKNELLAIPFLLIMVLRQLQEGIRRRTPKWILRRLQRKKK